MKPQGGRLPVPGNVTVVGIGASAGGLHACRKLLAGLHAGNGLAFIVVQHLDPTHESLMAELLACCTPMTVQQAADGMLIEREHVYVIPPGLYLAAGNGALHLSPPQARHGARLPFDFLLHSLAEAYGPRAICVILSGSGADGSLGLKSIKEQCGLVIAQDPEEAGFDGMPRSAIMTGEVDLVLPAAKIPEALIHYDRRVARTQAQAGDAPRAKSDDCVQQMIELLRTRTAYDFTLYKQGTLERRVERRMAMMAADIDDMNRYLEILRNNSGEIDLLAKDLLIHVTSFFRNQKVFDLLAEKIVPELVHQHPPDQPVRIWTAGCSTGEETYSLAMIFREAIAAANLSLKLQVFASDIDPEAIVRAREGLYPPAIEAEVSPERLARFFIKEDRGYRIVPDLRATVVFTVQDLLADPPFSRIDLLSCRNLLIYLRPEAQAKIASLFHFALCKGGILLLGSAEEIGDTGGRFEVISKPERLYRHIGRSRPGEIGFLLNAGDDGRVRPRSGPDQGPSHQADPSELCRRLVLETYAPATVLINRKRECLSSLGPTERYLWVVPEHPTSDILVLVRPELRIRLGLAIQQASGEKTRIVVANCLAGQNGRTLAFNIEVQPVVSNGEDLLLVCFVEARPPPPLPLPPADSGRSSPEVSRVAELEQELLATRTELQGAIANLEIVIAQQKAVNEEALSVNEEYQSTNEELLTSKEELQSLNEELAALNGQLQETLERQRTLANDLQNVLYSTDVATLFLDTALNIRFFTPAVRSLFNVISGDVGRPLADLRSLADDGALLADARTVLQTLAPHEHEIELHTGAWFLRRILPYRTQDNGVEGVVITFADITERKHTADALDAAKRQAEQATTAKTRFLAAASHDLRQPLQTLTLLQGLLANVTEGEKAQKLVTRFGKTLVTMSMMLNTLVDINQIEAGIVQPKTAVFPVNDLLDLLREEFTDLARAQGLVLRVVPCGLSICSNPVLLVQILRNLLSNALKYTRQGKVLLGCRRRTERLDIKVFDTGIGIPAEELQSIFDEYYQIDNAARERKLGLGLGLSIVQRLANLLGHRVRVRSQPGHGSVFTIEVSLPPDGTPADAEPQPSAVGDEAVDAGHRSGVILVVEDDPEVRDVLEIMLKELDYRTATAPDAITALDMLAHGLPRPDLLLADYNLPNGMDGLQLATALREKCHRDIPVIILTGDTSTDTKHKILQQNCAAFNKPVRPQQLADIIQRLLPASPAKPRARPGKADADHAPPLIYVVDDDDELRERLRGVLEEDGLAVEDFRSCENFLAAFHPGREACLIVDALLPGMSGLKLLRHLHDAGSQLPAIMITGNSDVQVAVEALKAGATDFIEKPFGRDELLAAICQALDLARDSVALAVRQETAAARLTGLTPRQRQIMEMVLAGHPSKNIAADLGISQRTVENHRAAIMSKTGSKSLPALARLVLAAASNGADPPSDQRGLRGVASVPCAAGRAVSRTTRPDPRRRGSGASGSDTGSV